MFYDKKCSIYKREVVTENFREVEKNILLHEDLDCDFFDERDSLQLEQGDIAQEEEHWRLTVVLDWFPNQELKTEQRLSWRILIWEVLGSFNS